ncbi:MAG: SDR family NAD(P)-dependent oxidoreductase [Pyrinomonadaceae bacterium]
MTLRHKPLTEQIALITGGGSGIGRAFAGALAASGARAVVIASRREDVLRKTADELNEQTGANLRVFNLCPGLVDVDHTGQDDAPRAGAIHVRNMARTLLCALSLDRNVIVEDINLYAR